MQLKDLCILDVASCTRNQTIAEAARIMRRQHVGDLVVVDDSDGEHKPIGIITDRDIVVDVLALGRDPEKTMVGTIMTTQLIIATGNEDVTIAVERMRTHGVRRIPVVDERECMLGIVTLDDLMQWLARQADALSQIVTKGQNREQRSKHK